MAGTRHFKHQLTFCGTRFCTPPTFIDFTFEPFFARDFANQALPFSACNIEKWVWPGNEARVEVWIVSLTIPL